MEGMEKQTAVEWLIEQLEEKGDLRETPSIRNIQLNIDTSDYLDLKRQAKEMEKQHIMDSHNQGYADGYRDNGNFSIDYYNETYKNK
jgi:hypothetical protein